MTMGFGTRRYDVAVFVALVLAVVCLGRIRSLEAPRSTRIGVRR
jgi:hypothetical protein